MKHSSAPADADPASANLAAPKNLGSSLTNIALLALALSYGGGFWLHLLHLAGDGFHAPHGLIDWLRDSTITLPLIAMAVALALLVANRLLARSQQADAPGYAGTLTVSIVALFASAAVVGVSAIVAARAVAPAAAGASATNLLLFCSLVGGAATGGNLSPAAMVLREGLLTLFANLVLGGLVYLLLRAVPWGAWLSRPVLEIRLPHISLRWLWRGHLARALSAAAVLVAAMPAPSTTSAAVSSAPGCRMISADVVAFDQSIVYNRLGVIDPEGMMFALRQDVVDKASGLSEASGGALTPGNVMLRSDKRPRPITLRMNVGDCLAISFQNLLAPIAAVGQITTRSAGISVLGLQLWGSILSDGSNVGRNADAANPTAGLMPPGGRTTYTFYGEREGGYELYSLGDNYSVEGIGTLAHGLFGAVNVEPRGAEWYRSQITRDDMDLATVGATPDGHPVLNYDAVYPAGHRFAGRPILKMLDSANRIINTDLTAVITGPDRGFFGADYRSNHYPINPSYPDRDQPFREFTTVFHDEAALIQAFPQFANPALAFTLHGVRDGKGINYGTGGIAAEVLANRLGLGPTANCPECKLEEFFLTSWALGDPAMIVDVPASVNVNPDGSVKDTIQRATKVFYPDDPSNVYHTYISDHTKFRNIHVGHEHHIFHLHSHQWLQTPDDDNSTYLDSQAIGPGSSYTYEIAYDGSGNRNKTPGDAIFHCHFYPHFAQGMWAMWRSNDTFMLGTKLDINGVPVPGSRAYPDGEITSGTPIPGLVPLPGIAMAPMPDGETTVVPTDSNGDGVIDSSQVDTDGNGVADFAENFAVAPASNPGYPFYIPGVAGHRPPTPALDMTEPLDMKLAPSQRRVYNGGLPRHVITGGEAVMPPGGMTPLDLSKVVESASAVFPPEAGTAAEQVAMAFHAQHWHDSFLPDGTPVSGSASFEANGLPPTPGAPYAEPCRNDDGTFNSAAPLRAYRAADIQLDMKLNKLGWHFPQARMLALWQDVGPTLSGARAPEPFVMRTNSGDCLNYYHTNLIPGVYEQDAYQVRTPTDIIGQHIHLVKFDVTSSDGSGNGFNYEDGTLSPDEVRERIAAIRAHNGCAVGVGAPGDTACPVAAAHAFFGPGPNNSWLGARTTIQRWWADPVLNLAGQDRTLGNVYTHDHYGPSTHQQTGLYATLIVEPTKSIWRDGEVGTCYGDLSLVTGRTISTDLKNGGCTRLGTPRIDGGPTSWRADVITADNAGTATNNFDKESFREFYFEFSDFQHAYVSGKGATFAKQTIIIGGKSYSIPVATAIIPDPLNAINPQGMIENVRVSSSSPWLMTKPSQEGQLANTCPSNKAMVFSATGCPESISTADIGTFSMNYRNEPVGARVLNPITMSQASGQAGDLSLAFSSSVIRADSRLNAQPKDSYPPLTADVGPGDPYTPLMRVYENDKLRIKVQVGATEEGHNASLWGMKWLQENASPNSGWRNSQMMGISEQFNWDMDTAVDPILKGRRTDYLFSPDNSVEGMWNGMWSLMRAYAQYRVKANPQGTDLLPLPNNRIDLKAKQVNTVSNLAEFDKQTKYQCPVTAPKRTFNVTAVLARDALAGRPEARMLDGKGTLVYNRRGELLHDPTAILYVRSNDLDAAGKLKRTVPIEPLVLRAAAGDCINMVLTNKLPLASSAMPDLPGYNMVPPILDRNTVSSPALPGSVRDTFNANDIRPSNRVGLRPQLVAYDSTRGGANSIGGNADTTVAPGTSASFWWYAGDLRYNTATGRMSATPIEFGAINLVSSDPIKHSNKGAVGSLVIEPQGATWVEDTSSRMSATVTYPGGNFRDFVVLFQDDVNMRFGQGGALADGGPVPYVVAGESDSQDSGMKGLNYRSDPIWYRMGISPTAATGDMLVDANGNPIAEAPVDLANLPFAENIIREVPLPGDPVTYDYTNVLANSQVGGDPQTPIFTAAAGQAIRLRVLEPGGHARNHIFVLHGHVWERNPYTSNCTWTPCIGSTAIGHNPLSQWVGSQEGHGPTDHWDIVPAHGAGGAFAVKGDYLIRDMSNDSFYDGVWGLLRVQ